jgi:hypothetical protein
MAPTNRSSLSALLAVGSTVMALGVLFTGFMNVAQAQASAERSAIVGGALPGGAVISSARSVAVAPLDGGAITAAPIAADGSFRVSGLAPGPYRLAITSVTVPKQTQGATFGEKVNQGLHAAGSALQQGAALARHDTAKNAIGNVRGREAAPDAAATPEAAPAANAHLNGLNGGMPSRLSMNVTVGKQTRSMVVDDTIADVAVGVDGELAGRVAAP